MKDTSDFIKSVLVDDLREIKADVVFRNFEAAYHFGPLINWEKVTLYLDHDLGSEGSTTGYHFLTLLLENGMYPQDVIVVSSNPVGCDNIARALISSGRYEKYIANPNRHFLRKMNVVSS